MKIGLISVVVFLLAFVSVVSGSECDDFCVEAGYDYGVCRETTEDNGFCNGDSSEVVYGFSPCGDEGLERCCCGYEEALAGTAQEYDVANNDDTGSEPSVQVNWPKALFIPLLIMVLILGALNFVWPKKKKNEEDLL